MFGRHKISDMYRIFVSEFYGNTKGKVIDKIYDKMFWGLNLTQCYTGGQGIHSNLDGRRKSDH